MEGPSEADAIPATRMLCSRCRAELSKPPGPTTPVTAPSAGTAGPLADGAAASGPATQPAPVDRSESELIADWLSTHPTLTLSLATFLFVVFQIYKAAGFEVNSTVELLRAGGLSSILVGVLLVQLPVELVLLTVGACWWLMAAERPEARATGSGPPRPRPMALGDPRAPAAASLVTLAVLGFWTTPWPLFLLSIVLSALALRVSIGRSARLGVERWTRRTALVTTGLFMLILIQRPTIWVPAEKVTTSDRGDIVAYVIAEDGPWTTLLTPDHRVVREETRNISERRLCAVDYLEARLFSRILRLRPAQLYDTVRERSVPRSLTPPCS